MRKFLITLSIKPNHSDRKVASIKAIQLLTGCDLKLSKDLVDILYANLNDSWTHSFDIHALCKLIEMMSTDATDFQLSLKEEVEL